VRLGLPLSSVVLTRGVSAHLVGHVLARTQRAAHVVTEHLGDDPLGMRALRRHQRLLLAPMRPRANAVVAVAISQVDRLVRDGYHQEAIRVIPSGVADDPPVADREALRADLGVGPDAFLAVLVAALRPEKRAALFVEQVSAAHAIDPSIQGVIVGDGPDAASVASAVTRSGGVVRMLGYRADAVDLMHALPMSVLEAMSVGRPVIATRVGDLPEVMQDGRTGFLVAPDRPSEMAHALVALARDRTRAEELGRAGRARQRQAFSIEAMTRGYAELVADLGRTRGRRVRLPVARAMT
jgi:glycosyltransferase involved in cell wall biosynthesis